MTGEIVPSNRERILSAAAEVIGDNGIQSFAVKDVARRAKVTPQLTYYHFPNRQALIRAALQYAADLAPSMNLVQHARGASGFEALSTALHAEFDEKPAVRNLNLIWNEITALPIDDDELAAELRRVTDRWNDQITIGILRGLADRSIATTIEPYALAQILTSTVEGLSQRWLAGLATPEECQRTLDVLLSSFQGSNPRRD
ncbi:TetR/AcrR family transcriptional regulator [Agromyces subbeticus]|uniref:TetR/AcrR family transcriptional regulator n=1 Tax=Agromyces subbeticus TaxID=293890 RepID=UPI0003B6A98F|nr:TetR/AcrR family transcriptional regulator [Agromyces subbeticus]